MPTFLNTSEPDFVARFAKFLTLRQSEEADVSAQVGAILKDVRSRGFAAVAEYTQKFDRFAIDAKSIRLTSEDIQNAYTSCDAKVVEALKLAADRIRVYHEKQIPQDALFTDALGVTLGWKWTAITDVGLYVPGGLASYPSSVLMNAIPAKVAGCKRLVMVVPTPDGVMNPAVLVAADLAKVDEIYRVGGAQAVGMLAYGVDGISPVHKIVGPGNKYVAEAKRQVFGVVGIDTIAGPSEILVVADKNNNPAWIAADLLSQAEHDTEAQSILITDDAAFADAVKQAVADTLQTLPRREIASASWEKYGAVILVKSWDEVPALVDAIAPEHVELAIDNPAPLAQKITHAGAIFMGRNTPEALGDYIAGPSHVLPTSRAAKFSSGLNVLDFMKRTSLIDCSDKGIAELGPQGEALAHTEGLQAHALSLHLRNKK